MKRIMESSCVRKSLALGLLSFLAFRSISSAYGAECQTYSPTPTGSIRVSQPAIVWRIVPSADTHIKGVTVSINDSPIKAEYFDKRHAIISTLSKPILPGTYNVACHIDFDDDTSMDKQWQFTVVPDAMDQLPAPDLNQQKALTQINARRQDLGLAPLQLDNALCAAATAHSHYMDTNHLFTHEEDTQTVGFTGHDPSDRVAAFGYAGVAYENVANGASGTTEAVGQLFDAPYHRPGFLQLGSPDLGICTIGQKTTLEIGATETEGVVTYPISGQRGVAISWMDTESPDPLRLHNASGMVGYPITFTYFSPDFRNITVTNATLTTSDGKPIPVYLNTPSNDQELTNGLILIPKQSLRPDTSYIVTVHAATDSGQDISKIWTFTTLTNPKVAAQPNRRTTTSAKH